jgi:hypothetical protein
MPAPCERVVRSRSALAGASAPLPRGKKSLVGVRRGVLDGLRHRTRHRTQASNSANGGQASGAQASGLRHQIKPRSLRLRASGGISTNSVSGAGRSRLISLRAVHASCHGRRDTASARSARRLGEHGPRRSLGFGPKGPPGPVGQILGSAHHRHVPSSRTTWRSRMRRALSHNRRSTTSAGQFASFRSSPFKSPSPTGSKSDPPGSSIDPSG